MEKIIKKMTAAILLTWLCVSAQISGVSAAESAEVKIPVSLNLAGAVPAQAENYTFQLIPESSGTPMPEGCKGSCEIVINGEDTVEYPAISYTVPGVYGYKIKQIAGDNTLCTYDGTVYYVRVTVTNANDGRLNVSVAAHRDAQMSDKKQMIEFENTYAAPPAAEKEYPQKTDTKVKKKSSLIQTGQLRWPVPFLTAAGIWFLFVGVRRKNKRNTEHAKDIR